MKSIYQIVDKQRKFLKRCGYKYTVTATNPDEYSIILNKNYKNNSDIVDLDDADYIVYVNISKDAISEDRIAYSKCVILGANAKDIPNFVKKFENRIINAVYEMSLEEDYKNGRML